MFGVCGRLVRGPLARRWRELGRARVSIVSPSKLLPCSITRLTNATIDAGAFGKGAALDRVASLGESGLIDLGGQLAVFGESPLGGWPVRIAHPRQRETPVVELNLTSGLAGR